MTKLVGGAKARELYHRRKIEGKLFNIVNHLVPDGELKTKLELAGQMQLDPPCVAAEQNLNAVETGSLEQIFDMEACDDSHDDDRDHKKTRFLKSVLQTLPGIKRL